jgi:aminoglycoside phosphotransferase family enzyme
MGQAINPQDAVFKFLGDPKTHGGREVRRIDTHAAAVFLAGDRAYKVKRAVHFPFLDYSTLAKRKEACLAELDANRRFASVLYRRVVPITRNASGQLALDGEGEPVEWAVEMLRFDEEQTLDCIAERKGIDDLLADKLATTVATMHQSAPGAPTIPWLDAVEGYLDQNKAAFSEYLQLFPREELEKLDHAARSALRRLRPLLLTRGQLGLVRRGHGDLHLGNVALVDGRPIPFDAIEFDPMVATGDVLYDLAFLLMDIVERRLDRAANIVFNRYFSETHRIEDIDGLAALPFFLSLRAAIRAKVTAARLQSTDAQGQGAILQSAQAYFQLALNLLSPPLPSSLRSEASPAPGNRYSRALWRPRWRRHPARSYCGPMSNVRSYSTPKKLKGCRRKPTDPMSAFASIKRCSEWRHARSRRVIRPSLTRSLT